MKVRVSLFAACAALLLGSSAVHALDEDGVKSLLKKNNCMKCHAENKAKDGPSYKEIADKFRGKADAEAKITTHVTTLTKIKNKDGKEEDHEPLKTKDEAEVKAIVQWILSRP